MKNPVERHRNVPTDVLENMKRHAFADKAEWELVARDSRNRLASAENAIAGQNEWLAELEAVLEARKTEGANIG